MKKHNRFSAIFVVLIMLAGLLAACGDTPPATLTPTVMTSATAEATSETTGDPTIEVADDATPPVDGSADATPSASVEPGVAPSGGLASDLGFRPEVNGFNFENYGGGESRTNLKAEDVRRLFGDEACASLTGGECTLTPAGQQWMEQVNESMNGGHCEGFAALSLIFYTQKESPDKFGSGNTFDLSIDQNEALQREIALYFATQYTGPTSDNGIKGKTPNELLDMLSASFQGGQSATDTYTMGIYQPGFKGGHAITPFAVVDKGNGIFSVLVYDNNYPGEAHSVDIDRNANTWVYLASINPNEPASEYKGDAETHTMTLTPTSPRLQTQACPFCDAPTGGAAGMRAPEAEYNEIWLEGEGNLLITDKDGKRTGYVGDQLVNEIPGASFQVTRSGDLWKDSPEPVYYIPTGVQFTLEVDGGQLQQETLSSVTMIGPGYDVSVDEIDLDPGQKDTITFSADGKSISYKTDYNESPDIELGLETSGADYSFLVKGMDIESGGVVNINIDPDKGRLNLDTTGNKEVATYSLLMYRYDDNGEQVFGHDDIVLEPSDMAYLEYLQWKGEGSEVPLAIDAGGDGTIDETLMLTDVK